MNLRRVPSSAGLTALALTAAVAGCAIGTASTPSAAAVRASDALGTGAALLRTGTAAQHAGLAAATRRPNVLMITADDAAPGDLRFMPHTRELIADRGVTFTNGVAPTPICVPARASLLTGQYTHNHKAYTIEGKGGGFASFDSRNALPTWLHRAGYDTLFIGKYLNGYGDAGSGTARHIESGWTQWRPTVGGSTYNFMHPTLNINGRLARYDQYNSNLFADQTVDLLERPSRKRQALVHVGQLRGAAPRRIPRRRRPAAALPAQPGVLGQDDQARAPRTPTGSGTWRCPRTPTCSAASGTRWNNGPSMSPLKRQNVREAYQQRIEALQSVDRGVARSVAALRRTGQLSNTVVIFTSDNGYLVGQHHNRFGKLFSYNDSQRIPILMKGPGIPRRQAGPHRGQQPRHPGDDRRARRGNAPAGATWTAST